MSTCQKCIAEDGGCCTNVVITLHESEAEPFFERLHSKNLPDGHIFSQDYVDADLWEYNSNEEACMFLGKDNNCSIYDKRPTICRTYPVMWTKRRYQMNYYVDSSCPLSKEVTVKELVNWMEHLPHPELMKKIGDLDFNTRDRDYVNLTVVSSKITNDQETIIPHIRSRFRRFKSTT